MNVSKRVRKSWIVARRVDLETIDRSNGRRVWRVSVADAGREPFLNRWFNDPAAALDFVARLESDSRRAWPANEAGAERSS